MMDYKRDGNPKRIPGLEILVESVLISLIDAISTELDIDTILVDLQGEVPTFFNQLKQADSAIDFEAAEVPNGRAHFEKAINVEWFQDALEGMLESMIFNSIMEAERGQYDVNTLPILYRN
ncbi:hypothetical protein HDU93_003332 [Gonapodya sp. JEL0774]|nr:hypothetical protein HDU93_003332 [Gonapodya sp. JEL0774]